MKELKRYTVVAMFLAIAIVLSYLESFIPLFVPGFKLGLSNVIIMIMLYEFKWYEALFVTLFKIIIVSIIIGTLLNPVFFMSFVGGLLAYLIMLILSRIKFFSIIGVSVCGAIFHSLGQIIVAIIIIDLGAVIYFLPFIGLISLGSGILSGLIAYNYLKRSITKRFIEVNNNESENIE